jgi:fimbrial chaperone protein
MKSTPAIRMNRGRTLLGHAAIACCVLAAPALHAGEFSVNPIRVDINATARSGAIGVRNEGKDKLSFQLQGMEWTQDNEGKDQYAPTRELIYFPKILTVESGEEGLVRVGMNAAVVKSEKTFRLFIEELPGPTAAAAKAEGKSAQINVLIRFGAPVFVAPVQPVDSAEIPSMELAKGVLSLTLRNTGNRHQLIEGIQLKGTDAQGAEVYALTIADRYLLAGVTKPFSTSIPADQCAKLARLTVEIKTDRLALARSLDVAARDMCG